MEDGPTHEFGKRKSVEASPAEPVKRSRHVALLLMGTVAIGGGAAALAPASNRNCNLPAGIAMAPGLQTNPDCAARGSSSSGGHGSSGGAWSRSNFYGGSTASSQSETMRGGFGSFAHSFMSHFSGGG
jgi:hypothetical protein